MSIAKKYGATEIKVFGSVARGEERSNSDIDILISLPKGYDIFKQRIPMQEALENIVGRPIDLIVRHEINPHLQAVILKEARDLFTLLLAKSSVNA